MSDIKEMREKVKDMKVLFVEDEDIVRNSTKNFLQKFFNIVVTCADGKEGLDEFTKNKEYDIIITDIKMPNLNGDIMALKMKEIKNEIFVVFLTASRALGDLRNKASDLCFKKPISFDDMRIILQKIGNSR